MPIDNRKVLQNILIPETKGSVRRTLTAENADEITSMFSQERLDAFARDGVLEGDWKSGFNGAAESLPTEAELAKMNKESLLKQAETEKVEIAESATNKEIFEAILAARK